MAKKEVTPPQIEIKVPPRQHRNRTPLLPPWRDATPPQDENSSPLGNNEDSPSSADSDVLPRNTPKPRPPILPVWSGMFSGGWRWFSKYVFLYENSLTTLLAEAIHLSQVQVQRFDVAKRTAIIVDALLLPLFNWIFYSYHDSFAIY